MSMELRMLLAVVLSFGVFFLYHVFFMKKAPLEKKEPTQIAERVEKEIPATVEDIGALDERLLQEGVAVPSPARQGRTITVSTPLYLAELTENGAALKSFKLKEYKETSAPGAPMKELIELSGEHKWTLGVSFLGESMNGLKQAVFDAATEVSLMNVTERSEDLIFTWTSPDGVTIIKTYTFSPGTYEIRLEIKVRNL
ncbi:MAG: membrane protein insertase YidC, partial [Desulfobacterales bacterium]|nr:membrane protein insertase YidC [Desulfobacterales bacterium]